jgi:hypothetical protein
MVIGESLDGVDAGDYAPGNASSQEAEKRVRDHTGECLAGTGLAAGERDGQSLALPA